MGHADIGCAQHLEKHRDIIGVSEVQAHDLELVAADTMVNWKHTEALVAQSHREAASATEDFKS